MASGDTLCVFTPLHNEPPSSNSATLDQITAATGLRPVLDYDSSTNETAIFSGTMPNHYAGTTGVTVRVEGAMDSANTGTKVCGLDIAFEKVATGDALGAAGSDFAAVNNNEATVDNTANNAFNNSVTFTDGADMDSVAAGNDFRLKVTRQNTTSGTNATGDFQLERIVISET